MQVWSRYGEDGQTKNLSQKSQVTIFLERRGRTFAITVRMNEEKDYWNLLQSPRQRKYAAMSNDRFSFLRQPVNKICIHSFKSILHKGSVSFGILFYPDFVMTGDGWLVPQPSRSSRQLFREFWIQSTDLIVTFAEKMRVDEFEKKKETLTISSNRRIERKYDHLPVSHSPYNQPSPKSVQSWILQSSADILFQIIRMTAMYTGKGSPFLKVLYGQWALPK